MLTARNISKSIQGKSILQNVSLQIQPNEITVLLGPSGAGKTSLLRALALIDLPDKGEVAVDEKTYSFPQADAHLQNPPWPKLTVVFQQLFLWPHLTLRENILLPARNLKNPHLERDFNELVRALHMKSFIDSYPNEASVGQRQRVALARAILLEPRYILMDEITSALDIEQIHEIIQFLPRLKAKGVGILIITHLLNFARRTADHILFLDHGRIVEEGNAGILSKPNTERFAKFLSVVEAAS